MRSFLKISTIIFLFVSCSKPNPRVITKTIKLDTASGKPVLSKIIDYGSYKLPVSGKIKEFKGDNKAFIGEILVLRGKNFGRQPTIMVADKPTPVLLRLADGGIVIRVPRQIPSGEQKVVVSTNNGITSKNIKIIRVAAAQAPGSSKTLLFNSLNWTTIKEFKFGKVLNAVFHTEKPFWYITTEAKGKFQLITIDTAAQPGPKVIDKKKIKLNKLLSFGISQNSEVLFAVADTGVVIYNLESASYPRAHTFQKFVNLKDKGNILDAAVSPDSKTLALLLSEDNLVKFYDVQVPDNIKEGQQLNVLPEAKVPLLRKLYFTSSQTDQNLWVLTGDTDESLKVGYHSSDMVKYELKSAPDRTGEIKVKKIQSYPMFIQKISPNGIDSATKGADESEDASLNKWTKYYYISLIHSELLTISRLPLTTPSGLQKGIETISTIKFNGVLHRLDYRGRTKSFYKSKDVIGSFKLSSDGKTALMAVCKPQVNKEKMTVDFDCGIRIHNLESGKAKSIKQGKIMKKDFVSPFNFGMTSIQD
jgi:WD40 repeat protein